MVQTSATTLLTGTEAAILGLLTDGDLSGYDIRKRVERSVGYFWAPARSQIYAVLPRLVAGGLATRRDIAQTGRPDKQVYRITKRGRQELQRWLEAPEPEPDTSRNPLLLKLFFGEHASREALLRLIRNQRASAERLRDELREIERRHPGRDADFFPALTRAYGLRYAEAVIRWARDAEREIEALGVRS